MHLLALIPHRDTLPLLRAYRRALFAGGFEGAYSFPAAAPLALLSRPLPGTALKSLAGALREESLAVGSRDGKIWTGSALMQDFPGGRGIRAFLGIELDIRLPGMAGPEQAEKGSGLLYRFRRAALCAALVPKAGVAPPLPIPPPPVFSFRAAALANIGFTFRALSAGGHAAEWETGPLIWLPDCKRRRGR